ncbi:hypothetical protein GQ600_16854 [Phytophthora cactorum]|nr:hypothetical protein GQ600_16854 [Phytophthora cactorum]
MSRKHSTPGSDGRVESELRILASRGVVGVVLGALMADFVGPWLDVPALSSRQKLACSACVAGALVVVGISTSALWAFPVPFFTFTLLPPVIWLFQLLLCAVSLLGIVTVGYPAFQVLFDKANHTVYEIPVLLLLPAFKIVTKRVFALVASHKGDIVPEHIVFTVDCFDALYLATCMPSLSAASLGVILAVDIAQTGVDLLELHQRTQNILTRLRMVKVMVIAAVYFLLFDCFVITRNYLESKESKCDRVFLTNYRTMTARYWKNWRNIRLPGRLASLFIARLVELLRHLGR